MADVILKAEHLKIGFFSERHSLFEKRKRNEVLKDLSFTMEKGEVLGLVGESGCGEGNSGAVKARLRDGDCVRQPSADGVSGSVWLLESGEENRLDYGRTASDSGKAFWKRAEAEGTRNVKKGRSG